MTADNKLNFKEIMDADTVHVVFFHFPWIFTLQFYNFLDHEAIYQKGTTWTGQEPGLCFPFMLQNWKQ